jgi:hypothetical protein
MTPQETIAHLQSQLDECRKELARMTEDRNYFKGEVEPMPDCKHCPEPDDDEPDYAAPKPLTPLENYNQNDEHNVR